MEGDAPDKVGQDSSTPARCGYGRCAPSARLGKSSFCGSSNLGKGREEGPCFVEHCVSDSGDLSIIVNCLPFHADLPSRRAVVCMAAAGNEQQDLRSLFVSCPGKTPVDFNWVVEKESGVTRLML